MTRYSPPVASRVIHVTADVPADIVAQVDTKIATLGISRSEAIRLGLQLFIGMTFREWIARSFPDEGAPRTPENGG
jgi:hypothetical protein